MGNAGSDGKSSSPPVTQAASTVRAPVDDADMESKLEKDALKASKDFQDALWGKGLFNMDDPDQDPEYEFGGKMATRRARARMAEEDKFVSEFLDEDDLEQCRKIFNSVDEV